MSVSTHNYIVIDLKAKFEEAKYNRLDEDDDAQNVTNLVLHLKLKMKVTRIREFQVFISSRKSYEMKDT